MISHTQYEALHTGSGLVDRSARGRLVVTGNDRRSYLQGLLTNDIAALTPNTGCYAAYLTPQGRMISDMRVFETGQEILIDLEGSALATVRDRLSQFIFSEDVEIHDQTTATAQLGVYGPTAAAVVAAVAGAARLVLPSDDIGIAGFDAIVPRERAGEIADALRAAGAAVVDDEVAETCRIEAGRPRFGIDMDEDTIPLEAGIEDRAISLTKGCYVGQEIIIRVLHRGHGRVARRLVGLAFDADATVPQRGETIRAADRDIGRITSATFSPALDRPIALGYVHRDFTEPGTHVSVSQTDGVVATLPFVRRDLP